MVKKSKKKHLKLRILQKGLKLAFGIDVIILDVSSCTYAGSRVKGELS